MTLDCKPWYAQWKRWIGGIGLFGPKLHGVYCCQNTLCRKWRVLFTFTSCCDFWNTLSCHLNADQHIESAYTEHGCYYCWVKWVSPFSYGWIYKREKTCIVDKTLHAEDQWRKKNTFTRMCLGQGWIMSQANVSKLHKVFSWKNYGFVRTTPEEFENGALFLRFGLPSTLIRQENGALRKRSSNLRNAGFSFSCGQKTFENGAFWKRWPHDSHVISLLDIF